VWLLCNTRRRREGRRPSSLSTFSALQHKKKRREDVVLPRRDRWPSSLYQHKTNKIRERTSFSLYAFFGLVVGGVWWLLCNTRRRREGRRPSSLSTFSALLHKKKRRREEVVLPRRDRWPSSLSTFSASRHKTNKRREMTSFSLHLLWVGGGWVGWLLCNTRRRRREGTGAPF
jgi:hypothetical protein